MTSCAKGGGGLELLRTDVISEGGYTTKLTPPSAALSCRFSGRPCSSTTLPSWSRRYRTSAASCRTRAATWCSRAQGSRRSSVSVWCAHAGLHRPFSPPLHPRAPLPIFGLKYQLLCDQLSSLFNFVHEPMEALSDPRLMGQCSTDPDDEGINRSLYAHSIVWGWGCALWIQGFAVSIMVVMVRAKKLEAESVTCRCAFRSLIALCAVISC